MIPIKFKRLHEEAKMPTKATECAAGFDLYSAVPAWLEPCDIDTLECGFAMGIPKGFEGQIRPSRSAARYGITVLNAPGTIDSDYRGEVKVILVNLGPQRHEIVPGDRIAQLVISSVIETEFVEVEELTGTVRGEGGFGSTGK